MYSISPSGKEKSCEDLTSRLWHYLPEEIKFTFFYHPLKDDGVMAAETMHSKTRPEQRRIQPHPRWWDLIWCLLWYKLPGAFPKVKGIISCHVLSISLILRIIVEIAVYEQCTAALSWYQLGRFLDSLLQSLCRVLNSSTVFIHIISFIRILPWVCKFYGRKQTVEIATGMEIWQII